MTAVQLDPFNPEHVAGVLPITRGYYVSQDGARRVSGRHITAWVIQLEPDGSPQVRGEELVVKRQRFRIPKGHQWRGKRP